MLNYVAMVSRERFDSEKNANVLSCLILVMNNGQMKSVSGNATNPIIVLQERR